MSFDISRIILEAKIGRERKAAQEDTCGPFAVALHDVLLEQGVKASLHNAAFFILPGAKASWYHAIVEVDGTFYDSMGEFTHEIVRTRVKIHPKVQSRLDIKPDDRAGCYEDELQELHIFLTRMLRNAIEKARSLQTA